MTKFADQVLAQYEKNKQSTSGSLNKVSQEERMKKYFAAILPKGVRSKEMRVRLLPTPDGSSPFEEVKLHEIQVDGKWVKLYDPAQEGKPSPLNVVREALLATGTPEDKEIAKNYRSKTYYICKLIDRDNEQDGPKFWRFKHNTKQEGVLDKIVPIVRNKGDITDPLTGRDLILSLSLTKSGNGKEYTTINSIIPDDASPLHVDADISAEWVADPLTWEDVYAKKSEEYLDLVARGLTPKWDTALSKYVAANAEKEEMTIAGTKGSNPPEDEDPQSGEEESEELPF